MEFFTISLEMELVKGSIILPRTNGMAISHLIYADALLIFCQALEGSAQNLEETCVNLQPRMLTNKQDQKQVISIIFL